MKTNAVPQKGDFIKIVVRKCGSLQKHVGIGDNFQVISASKDKSGVVFVEASYPKSKRKTIRINSSRFDWVVMSAKEIVEEKFKEECHNDAVALVRDFTKEEQTQIAIVPLVFYHIIWRYALLAVEQSVSHRVECLKKATRLIRETKKQYDRFLAKDLDSLHTSALERQTDDFVNSCQKDFVIMYYTVNGEFKKAYPNYPYDELRTYAIMALLLIRFVEEHNKRMDKMIAERLGSCKSTLLMPAIAALKTLMECFAGIDERFDFDSQHIKLSMKIFENNVKSIEFDLL